MECKMSLVCALDMAAPSVKCSTLSMVRKFFQMHSAAGARMECTQQ